MCSRPPAKEKTTRLLVQYSHFIGVQTKVYESIINLINFIWPIGDHINGVPLYRQST